MTDAGLRYLVEANDRDLRELRRSVAATNRELYGTAAAGGAAAGGMSRLEKAGLVAGRTMRVVGKAVKFAALGFGVAAGVGLAATVKFGTDELMEHARVAAQTTQVLKSTGGAAGVTAGHVEKLATSIMRKTGIDDEQIQTTENLLLGYTKVRNELGKGNDIFDRATKLVTDYSVRTGKSAAGATNVFGKALQEIAIGKIPTTIRGIGKLDDSLVKQMTAMVKAGDVAGAQGLLMTELERKYGGAAEAAGRTLPGKLNILRESFSNLAGEIVGRAAPSLTHLVDWTIAHMPQIEATIRAVFEGIAFAWSNVLRPTIDALTVAVQTSVEFIRAHWDQIASTSQEVWARVSAAVAQFVSVVQGLWARFGGSIMAQVRATWDFVKGYVQAALTVVRGIINVVGGLLQGDWSRVWQGIQQIFSGVWNAIKAIVTFQLATLRNTITAGLQALLLYWQNVWNVIKATASRVWSGIVAAVQAGLSAAGNAAVSGGRALMAGLLGALRAGWNTITGWLSSVPGFFRSFFGGAGGWLVDAGRRIIEGFYSGLVEAWHKVQDLVGSMGGWIAAHKGPESKDAVLLKPHGRAVMVGFAEGMLSTIPHMVAAINRVVDAIKAQIAARADLRSAFQSLAQQALSGFDAVVAAWQSPTAKLLEKMRAQDAAKAVSDAVAAAQADVASAQAALGGATRQEGESDEDFAARMAKLQQDVVAAQAALGAAERAQVEYNLEQKAAAEEAAHAKKAARDRENLARDLLELQSWLAKHPGEYEKMGAKIQAVLAKYHVPMFEAGQRFASRFADGLRDGIAAVAKAAKELADALAKYVPHSPAEEGPLAFDVYEAGRSWSDAWARGIGSVDVGGAAARQAAAIAADMGMGLGRPSAFGTLAGGATVDPAIATPTASTSGGDFQAIPTGRGGAPAALLHADQLVIENESDADRLVAKLSNAWAVRQ